MNLFLQTLHTFGERSFVEQLLHTTGQDIVIGALALTESTSGVMSGMRVDVLFDDERLPGQVVLYSPHGEIYKRYISQASIAHHICIVASNHRNRHDIRIFVVPASWSGLDIRVQTDWTTPAYLDICEIRLHNVIIPSSWMLPGSVDASRMRFLTGISHGRACIARSVVAAILGLIIHCAAALLDNPRLSDVVSI